MAKKLLEGSLDQRLHVGFVVFDSRSAERLAGASIGIFEGSHSYSRNLEDGAVRIPFPNAVGRLQCDLCFADASETSKYCSLAIVLFQAG